MVEVLEDASLQLQGELEDSIAANFSYRRPILTHLNADTTWLLSLPYPEGSNPSDRRQRYNILIDPWLVGPQSDVAGWFSIQWHNVKSSVESIHELEEMLRAREDSGDAERDTMDGGGSASFLDAVIISHEFTDHCHQATLKEVHPAVPVFATSKAVQLIQSWKHFEHVFDMNVFGAKADWRTTSKASLPSWLGIGRLITPGDALYYHSAIVICFQIADRPESVIYTPHGVVAESFSTLLSAEPFVQNLAFLHGLHDVSIWLTKQLNLGAFNAIQAARLLRTQYWVGTHDEVKRGGGILAPFLRRKAWQLADVWSKEGSSNRGRSKATTIDASRGSSNDPRYLDLKSGESLILE